MPTLPFIRKRGYGGDLAQEDVTNSINLAPDASTKDFAIRRDRVADFRCF
jgi:hypothetical protein